MTTIRFLLFSYPGTKEELQLEIEPGTTFRELCAICEKQDGVTAPASVMVDAGGMVEGRYISNDYVFDGTEKTVDIMNQIGDG